MANKMKEKRSEEKVLVAKVPDSLVNKDVTIDLNPETKRYVLRQNGEFLFSDINQDVVRRTANDKFNLNDAGWHAVS